MASRPWDARLVVYGMLIGVLGAGGRRLLFHAVTGRAHAFHLPCRFLSPVLTIAISLLAAGCCNRTGAGRRWCRWRRARQAPRARLPCVLPSSAVNSARRERILALLRQQGSVQIPAWLNSLASRCRPCARI